MTIIIQKSPFQVPTIDISPYISDPASTVALKVVAQVREACMKTGFFEIIGHGVASSLQDQVFAAAKALFALPLEEKMKMDRKLVGSSCNRGYEMMGTQILQKDAGPDQKEGFYISEDFPSNHPNVKAHPAFLGPNIWPSASVLDDSTFRLPLEAYHAAMLRLSDVILSLLAAGLPYGPDIFTTFASNDPLAVLRLLHYPPTPHASLGAGAHTDFGAFTLLLQDEHEGLEVRDPETGGWTGVPPRRGAFVVNCGDMLQRWTKGVYRSSLHRVVNSGGEERYSAPFFYDGNLDCELVPFEGGLGEGEEVLTVEGHMRERFASTYA